MALASRRLSSDDLRAFDLGMSSTSNVVRLCGASKTIVMVEQNAKKGLAFADIGYVLVSGETAIAGAGDDLLQNPDVGRLFLGG